MHSEQLIRLEQYLKQLPTLDAEPEVIRKACFYIGWQLQSPNSWAYRNIWTGEESKVELESLIEAVKAKYEAISDRKSPQGKDNRLSANKSPSNAYSTNGKASKPISKR